MNDLFCEEIVFAEEIKRTKWFDGTSFGAVQVSTTGEKKLQVG